MKKTRISALMLTLVLMLTVSHSLAESIFPQLEEETEQSQILVAPSYGSMANVTEDQVEQSAEDGTIVTYKNVDASGYNRFGVYLGERGFAVTGQEKQENKIAYAVSDGQVSFVMIYEQGTKIMHLIYPNGTDYEKALFPGYTKVSLNEKVSIPELGDFIFDRFFLNRQITYCSNFFLYEINSRWKDEYHSPKTADTYLTFTFYNKSASDKAYYGDTNHLSKSRNDLVNMELIYLLSDQTYTYPVKAYGTYWAGIVDKPVIAIEPPWHKTKGWLYYEPMVANALESIWCGTVFDLPVSVRNSADGTLAVKLTFKTGEKYVLVLREDGANQYE